MNSTIKDPTKDFSTPLAVAGRPWWRRHAWSRWGAGMLVFSLTMASGWAQLTFDTSQARKKAQAIEEQVDVVIPFTNTGKTPVTISHIETTCGCLSAQANLGESNAVYPAGEKGFIKATFKVGTMEGEIKKNLYVHSDDPVDGKRPIEVTLEIPKIMEVTPEVTTWTLGGTAEAKTVSIKILGPDPINVTAVSSSRTAVSATLREVVKGREYEVIISPSSTSEPTLGAVRISTNSSIPRFQNKMCFFNVIKAPAKPAGSSPAPAPVAPAAPAK
jgi:hypothetical protein